MPFGDVDKIAKLVPDTLNITLDDAFAEPALGGGGQDGPRSPSLAAGRQKLGDSLGTRHAAGVVISDEPLWSTSPLYRDPKSEEIITQYPMGPIELGLLKMDFLGSER